MIAPQPGQRPAFVLGRTHARIIWSVLAAALAVAFVGAVAGAANVPASRGTESLGPVFLLVAGAMVSIDLVASYLVPARVRRKPPAGAPPDAVAVTQTILGSALALGAALMCCVFYFVSREPALLLLVIPCAAVLLHWFPSESRWQRILPASGTAPARRMMRE